MNKLYLNDFKLNYSNLDDNYTSTYDFITQIDKKISNEILDVIIKKKLLN